MTTPAIESAYAIINDAYVDAGLKQRVDTLNGEQLAEGLRRLRDIINYCQTKGLKVFTWADTTLTLTAGQADYTFMPSGSVNMTKPLRPVAAFYLYDDTNVRRPLTQLSMQEYYALGQAGEAEENQGTISQYYMEKLYDRLRATLWLCPDTNEAAGGDVHFVFQSQITNPTELDENVQFPLEWRLGLRWSLAYDLSTGQPQAVIDRCQQNMDRYMTALEDWDVEEVGTQFQPDPRMAQGTGNFR